MYRCGITHRRCLVVCYSIDDKRLLVFAVPLNNTHTPYQHGCFSIAVKQLRENILWTQIGAFSAAATVVNCLFVFQTNPFTGAHTARDRCRGLLFVLAARMMIFLSNKTSLNIYHALQPSFKSPSPFLHLERDKCLKTFTWSLQIFTSESCTCSVTTRRPNECL